MSFKVFRTSKTRVTNLPSFKNDRPKSGAAEPQLKSEEMPVEESGVGDAFEDLFGEAGQEVKPEERNVPKRHVKKDDEPDDEPVEDAPPKREYSGSPVEEGVNFSKAGDADGADLDDLISAVMDDMPDEGSQPEEKKRSTSTPSKEDDRGTDDADFGGFISMIRDDSEPPPQDKKDEKPRDIPLDRRSGAYDDGVKKDSGKRSSGSTTTTTYSFSSKFVPTIPASFYKDIQTKLEDLIFKFECLDNEYAALQKISHKVYIETMDVKKILSNED